MRNGKLTSMIATPRLLLLAALLGLAAGCTPRAPAPPSAAASPAAPTPWFRDAARDAGIQYRWEVQGKRPLNILQTIGNGCAFLDFDGDSRLDILLIGPKLALYRGNGKGRFVEATAQAGLETLKGRFLGGAVGDYNADGYPDLYLSAYRGGSLLQNQGGKRFVDVTRAAGLPAQPWGTSCAFVDIDGDGWLDLFVGNYVVFGPDTKPQLCDNSGIPSSCGPRFYKPERSRLFRGGPGGKFVDVTRTWKAHLTEGKCLGVAVADFDGSGRPSLALANDEVPGDLLVNQGKRFDNQGKNSGTAYDDSGNVHGGMGVDWGDYNNDGKFDLFVATFQNESKNIYHNDGGGLFTDKSAMLGLSPAQPAVTFGAKWFDADNDGWLDLALANGHVQDNIDQIDKSARYRQPIQLFRNESGARFEEISQTRIDPGSLRPIVGRGLAAGDYDNDGRVDLLVVDSEGEPLLLHNEAAPAGHWIGLTLAQPTGGNRGAYGALVTLEAGGRKFLRQCHPGGSYLSSSDPRVHFGLGDAARVDRLTVRWPDGKTETFTDLPADRYLTLARGGKPE